MPRIDDSQDPSVYVDSSYEPALRENASEAAASGGEDAFSQPPNATANATALRAQCRALEAALKESRRTLRLIADHAPVLIAHCGADRKFKFVNRPGAERLGLSPLDFIGKTFNDILGKDASDTITPYVDAVLRGERVEYETSVLYRGIGMRHMWAAYVPEFDASGKVVGFVSAILDITERKRAEEALKARERQLSLIYKNVADCLFVLSVEGDECYRFSSINETFLTVTGYKEEQVLGKRIEEVLPPSSITLVLPKYREAIQDKKTVRWEEVVMMPAGKRVGEVTVTPMAQDLSGRQFLIGTFHDITALKQAEEVLREADRRKDEFLAMLAHELRNPLAPIRNAAEILHILSGDDARLQSVYTVIDRQLEHLTHLIDDLLDVSRITRGKIRLRMERMELLSAVARAIETVRPHISARRQELRLELPYTPIEVVGDLTRLTQVIGNLLHNASKFTHECGYIWLSVQQSGSEAVIRVCDNGVGIAPDVLPGIFDLFAQADRSLERSQGGLGIGLTLVRSLVEMHGGTVEAKSEGLDRGSEFIVRLGVAPARC